MGDIISKWNDGSLETVYNVLITLELVLYFLLLLLYFVKGSASKGFYPTSGSGVSLDCMVGSHRLSRYSIVHFMSNFVHIKTKTSLLIGYSVNVMFLGRKEICLWISVHFRQLFFQVTIYSVFLSKYFALNVSPVPSVPGCCST